MFAMGIHVEIFPVIVTYAAAKIIGAVPVTPGGLGPVEAAMVAALTATGVASTTAVGAVICYRLVSFLLMTATGWVTYLITSQATGAYTPAPSRTPPKE